MEKLSKDNINQFKRLVKEVVQETVVKNPFKVGDLVKLRPDILKRISLGPNRDSQNWHRTLTNLQDKMGKIIKIFPDNKNVNVEYKESWVSKDDWNRESRINSIGIDSEELVPYSEDPSMGEGVGWVHTKDIKKDPHHTTNKMTGKVNRWTVKYENESDIKELRDLGKVDETSENPNKNYIIFGRRGPQSVYYCESSYQGIRLLSYGQDVAKRFKTKEEVYRKIFELKQKYKGISHWDYEVVPAERSEWEKTYTATVKLGPNTISVPVKNSSGDWVVKWMVNRSRDDTRTYYTDDKQDALNTYTLMVKSAEEENKKLTQS